MYNISFFLYTHSLSLRKNKLYKNMFKPFLCNQIVLGSFFFIKTYNFITLIYFENNYIVVKPSKLFKVINVFSIE